MYVVASGALILAILRAAVYLGLAFGAVTVTWAPISQQLLLGKKLARLEEEQMLLH
jgi:hypothetical protein